MESHTDDAISPSYRRSLRMKNGRINDRSCDEYGLLRKMASHSRSSLAKALAKHHKSSEVPSIEHEASACLRINCKQLSAEADAQPLKTLRKPPSHDVKAVEYFLLKI